MKAEILIRLPEKELLCYRSLVSPVNRRIQISGNTDQELENRTGHKKRGRDEIVKIFLPLCCYQRPMCFFSRLFFELDSVELPKAGFEYRDCDHKVLLKVLTYSRKFIWYDLKTRTYEDAEIPCYQWLFDAYTFGGSLVSPKLKTKRIKNVI
ncbi:hypothetical protein DKX38_023282 [Salix brachista]|uniref:Uncharacterized protein n=1 Tax=Salix brachista TaxID=2182728 RepID=A0A5N5JNV7_9ROSI|nr:hypothetical protein DKX38_023282 [Salix brachista]